MLCIIYNKFNLFIYFINILSFVNLQKINNDLQCLSELPLEQLLQIKKSIYKIYDNTTSTSTLSSSSSAAAFDNNNINLGDDNLQTNDKNLTQHYIYDDTLKQNITALPLFNRNEQQQMANKRVGYGSGGGGGNQWINGIEEEEKPSKIQKIFQISITSLAFLAFGGYLFCMIVQAIKSKGTTYFHPALMPMTTMSNAPGNIQYKRKKNVFRMKRQMPIDNNIDRRSLPPNDSVAEPSPDEMYKFLLIAAETYTKLYQ